VESNKEKSLFYDIKLFKLNNKNIIDEEISRSFNVEHGNNDVIEKKKHTWVDFYNYMFEYNTNLNNHYNQRNKKILGTFLKNPSDTLTKESKYLILMIHLIMFNKNLNIRLILRFFIKTLRTILCC
jgi:hypothetical protein